MFCPLNRIEQHEDRDVYTCKICSRPLTTPPNFPPPNRKCDTSLCQPCSCQGPGFCQRHKIAKNKWIYDICCHDSTQRANWDFMALTGRSPNGQQPSIARKVINFSVAAVRHWYSGLGTRTDSEIERILDICHTCPSGRFNGQYCEHDQCGCKLSRKKYFSKIAWADQHCPDGHW